MSEFDFGALAQIGIGFDHENRRRGQLAGFQPARKHGETHIAAAGENKPDRHRKPSKGRLSHRA